MDLSCASVWASSRTRKHSSLRKLRHRSVGRCSRNDYGPRRGTEGCRRRHRARGLEGVPDRIQNANWAIDRHVAEFGQVDLLANNARMQMMTEESADIDLDQLASVVCCKILRTFTVTTFALPHLPKGSSIINTTSVTTFCESSSMPGYVSTKAAIMGFTHALARDLTKKGVESLAGILMLIHVEKVHTIFPAVARQRKL
ncbi:hypothetical protein C8Q70DRAFT_106378 [Cubamyces menziesii]|nr:hypothetical protein C8Q70DRAFT_106378 [Cubamyces menziesii]